MAANKKTTKKKTAPTVKPEPDAEAPEDAQAPAIPDFPDEAIGDDVPEIQIDDDQHGEAAAAHDETDGMTTVSTDALALPAYADALIPVPIGEMPTGNDRFHTELHMHSEQAIGWRLLLDGLKNEHARMQTGMKKGRYVQEMPDAIRWMGEQIALAAAAAAATPPADKES